MVTFYQVKSGVGGGAPNQSWDDDTGVDSPGREWSGNTRMAVTAVIGLALVGLALTAGGVVIQSLGTTETVGAPDPPGTVDVGGVEGGNLSEPSPMVSEPVRILVHVVGQVRAPGVVDLEVGSRVRDAIEAAGGITADAALESLNLARVVGDGEQVVVPGLDDVVDSAGDAGSARQSGMISLSRADQATLDSLPGIGPALAGRIIAWRETHGPFSEVSDVLAVSGIGPSTLEQFAHLVIP